MFAALITLIIKLCRVFESFDVVENLVTASIDGLDYYLRTSHESYWAKDYGDKNT